MRKGCGAGGRMPRPASSSTYEATARVLPSPLNASFTPNELYGRGLFALMNACSLQTLPDLTNTYAAPTQMFAAPSGGESLSHPAGLIPGVRQSSSPAPDAIVLPSSLIATEYPSWSVASVFDPLMYASCVQAPARREKT